MRRLSILGLIGMLVGGQAWAGTHNSECNAAPNSVNGTAGNTTCATGSLAYYDDDGDGWADDPADTCCFTSAPTPSTAHFTQVHVPVAGTPSTLDCDETKAAVNPGATEVCDASNVDENCNTFADDLDTLTPPTNKTTWYLDSDSDGYSVNTTQSKCDQPSSYIATLSSPVDCNDASASINPGATEVCDASNVDENCNTFADDLDTLTPPSNKTTWYLDSDGDTYSVNTTQSKCDQPSSYVSTLSSPVDCNDASASINPGATEVCDSSNVDENCNTFADDLDTLTPPTNKTTWYLDNDGDTYSVNTTQSKCDQPTKYISTLSSPVDCNDAVAAINPGATEVCDSSNVDENCNTFADDLDTLTPPTNKTTWYLDNDSDTYSVNTTQSKCDQPTKYIATLSSPVDCNDASASINPGATEVCDSSNVDENCNGLADDLDTLTTPTGRTTWYYDGDGDTYGNTTPTQTKCDQPSGYVSNSTDCDDSNSAIHPGATETCNGVDDNCVSGADEGLSVTWYKDTDGDGYGLSTSTKSQCSQPVGYVALSTDCNDANSAINPGAQEVCDSANVDEDCDTKADDADSSVDATTKTPWYRDTDTDTYGNPSSSVNACDKPTGYVADKTDCNDSAKSVHPGATEVIANGVDEDCDSFEKCVLDVDVDGYGDDAGTTVASSDLDCVDAGEAATSDDCDDNDPGINPGEQEVCDAANVDEDCDNKADDADSSVDGTTKTTYYNDADNDTFGAGASSRKCDASSTGFAHPVTNRSDCDDTSAVTYPGAAPKDSTISCEKDTDGDGYGDLYATVAAVVKGTDCDDAVSTTFPSAAPNDNPSACMSDADGDDFGSSSPTSTRIAKGTDCDDARAATYKNAPETWYDGIDADCSGGSDYDQDHDGYDKLGYNGGLDCDDSPTTGAGRDIDNDGDGEDECDGDCNDANAAIYASATEVVGNGIDENCDGIEKCYVDDDLDGHADLTNLVVDSVGNTTCSDPGEADYTVPRDDCDDTSATAASTFPGAAELESSTLCERDVDGDGYGDIAAAPPVIAGLDCADTDVTVTQGQDLDLDGTPTCPSDPTVPQQDCDDNDSTTRFFFEPGASTAFCMSDVDGDGWGAKTLSNAKATPGTDCDDTRRSMNQDDVDLDGYTTCENDCNDSLSTGYNTFPGAAEKDSITFCEQDNDGDGYGDSSALSPITAGTDCNDADATIKPDNIWYADTDGDTFGDPLNSTPSCSQPFGYVLDNTDCDDTDAFYNADTVWYIDNDGDAYGDKGTTTKSCTQPGFYVGDNTDCNDTQSTINPGATEVCDPLNVDENCNGKADDTDTTVSASTLFTWYVDSDHDLYGLISNSKQTCDQPAGYVSDKTDCDDSNAVINPGMAEICDANPATNSVDENCNGTADDADAGVTPSTRYSWYKDADSDLYGNPSLPQSACDQPTGYVRDNTDCNDGDAETFPGAAEKEANAATLCEKDDDLDGYGDSNKFLSGVTPGSDCNDVDGTINPAALEVCDGGSVDENCNGTADDADSSVNVATWSLWYQDLDNDSYGNNTVTVSQCDRPIAYVLGDPTNPDCDDTNAYTYPGAAELCDGNDNDCDRSVPAEELDSDSDRYVACVDTNNNTIPWVGSNPAILASGDCNNSSVSVYPGAPEYCNNIDDNCDGVVDDSATNANNWYADSDADSYGDPSVIQRACNQPAGYVRDATDCNDSNSDVHPNFTDPNDPTRTEICDGLDNNCDGVLPSSSVAGNTDGELDNDRDGYVPCSPDVPNLNGNDCDDGDIHITPGANGCELDADGDGYAGFTIDASGNNTGISVDCDDSNGTVHPNAEESCETGASQTDQDCDGNPNTETCEDPTRCSYLIAENRQRYTVVDGIYEVRLGLDPSQLVKYGIDFDSNGTLNGQDCILPGDAIYTIPDTSGSGAFATFDGANLKKDVDNNCTAPNGGPPTITWVVAALPAGVNDPIEVNRTDTSLSDFPIAKPDNGQISLYPDTDADGYGDDAFDASRAGKVCVEGFGYTAISGDCRDDRFDVNPDAAERCDGLDNDCNGVTDDTKNDRPDGCEDRYQDVDQDSFGTETSKTCICLSKDENGDPIERPGYVEDVTDESGVSIGFDCDDLNRNVYPDAPEALDGNDTNCDGFVPVAEADCDDDTSFAMPPGNPSAPITDLSDSNDYFTNCDTNAPARAVSCWGQQLTLSCRSVGHFKLFRPTPTKLWSIDLSLSKDGYGGRFQGGRRIWSQASTCTPGIAGDCDDQCTSRCEGQLEVCDGIDNDCNDAGSRVGTGLDVDGQTAINGMATSSQANAVDGLISENETDFDQDGSIGCTNFSIQDPQTVLTSRDCSSTVVDPAISADCNNFCSLSNATAEERCDGFTNLCDGPLEGTDADKDGDATCGLGSASDMPEDVYLVAYFPPSDQQNADTAEDSHFVPLILPRANALYCDDPLWSALSELKYSSPDVRRNALSCLQAATLVDDSLAPNEKTSEQLESEHQLLANCVPLGPDAPPVVSASDAAAVLYQIWSNDICEGGENCGIVRVTLQPADDRIPQIADAECRNNPAEAITRTVWTRDRILSARKMVVEQQCERAYGMPCDQVTPETPLVELADLGTYPPQEWQTTLSDSKEWWLEIGRYDASVYQGGTLLGCWGDPAGGDYTIAEKAGGDCNDSTGSASRDEPEGPSDLVGIYLGTPADCDTCLDGIDNNCDGQIDCADPSCAVCFAGQGGGCAAPESTCTPNGCTSGPTEGNLSGAMGLLVTLGLIRRKKRA